MGCPHIYYHRALQMLAHALACSTNGKLAKELANESDIEKLEKYILSKKTELSDKEFYYAAGGAAQCTISEAYEEGCDPLNASICGVAEFEDFIGLEDLSDGEG
jgi:hypothetical protein